MNSRRRFVLTILIASGLSACSTVTINPADDTPPKVSILYLKPGMTEPVEAYTVRHDQTEEATPLKLICVAKDPDGLRAINLRTIDMTVATADCAGQFFTGNYGVSDIPGPQGKELSGDEEEVIPTELQTSMELGILPITAKPAGRKTTCYPAGGQQVEFRCRGVNWNSERERSRADKVMTVTF